MPVRKHLSLGLYAFGISVVPFVSGCQSTGGSHDGHSLAHETRQFAPDPRGGASSRELRPVSNRNIAELLREADASFQRASALEQEGKKDEAANEYRHMLLTLEQAGLDPGKFTSSRREFEEQLAKEAKAMRRQHNGEVKSSEIKIPVPLPPAVLAQINRIQNDYANSFQSALDRSQKYMPNIRQRLRSAGLPEELAYVAMIESHCTEKINSRAGAGGMWQFMPETGRIHGLRQDGFVDERYDWNAATDAAISYFTKLRDHFDGNWPLAIASYNCGEYGLQRAVAAAGGESDFFRLIETPPANNMIKTETKDYYPKFLAYWIVSEQAERFGFSVNPPSSEPTTTMAVRGSYALEDLEDSMGLADGTLARLNPSLVRAVTPPIGENVLRIPVGSEEKLSLALASVPQYGQGVRTHKVRKGETLAAIAKKYGVSEDELKQTNKLKSAKLKHGQSLKLPYAVPVEPARGGRDEDALVAAAKEEKAKRESAPVTTKYVVKKGDTLARIAEKNGVGLDALISENKLSKKSQIKAGQTLKITKAPSKNEEVPVREAKAAEPAPTKETTVEHKVAQGEYLAVVARKYGVSVADLEQWNGLEKGETIRVGQTLSVRKPASASTTASAKSSKPATEAARRSVSVEPGDTLSKIASKNGVALKDLLAWNDLNDKSTIKAGQKLVIMGGAAEAASSEEEKDTEQIVLAKAETKSTKPAAKSSPKGSAQTIHTVSSGQTATSIAKRYGVGVPELFKWNNWGKDHVLRPGDKVVVQTK